MISQLVDPINNGIVIFQSVLHNKTAKQNETKLFNVLEYIQLRYKMFQNPQFSVVLHFFFYFVSSVSKTLLLAEGRKSFRRTARDNKYPPHKKPYRLMLNDNLLKSIYFELSNPKTTKTTTKLSVTRFSFHFPK